MAHSTCVPQPCLWRDIMRMHNVLLCLRAGLLAGVFVTPTNAANMVYLPGCEFFDVTVTADLSTHTATNWSVTGPGAGGPTSLTTPFAPWSALSYLWIQPQATPGPANGNFAAGNYTYTIQFHIDCDPNDYIELLVRGQISADNSFTAYLNDTGQLASCPGPACYSKSVSFENFAGPFQQGTNTIKIVVHNNEGYTGVAADISLSATCGAMCCRAMKISNPPN